MPDDEDNRALRVSLESDAFYRSSEVPLDAASRSHRFPRRSTPEGEYVVTVELHGPAALKKRVQRLHVMGIGPAKE